MKTETEIQTEITESNVANGRFYATISAGKTSATLCIGKMPNGRMTVWVVVNNASHRAWRGIGKMFNSMMEAKANYKSPAMQAILARAEEETSKHLAVA